MKALVALINFTLWGLAVVSLIVGASGGGYGYVIVGCISALFGYLLTKWIIKQNS